MRFKFLPSSCRRRGGQIFNRLLCMQSSLRFEPLVGFLFCVAGQSISDYPKQLSVKHEFKRVSGACADSVHVIKLWGRGGNRFVHRPGFGHKKSFGLLQNRSSSGKNAML